jgi:hypothetical protein
MMEIRWIVGITQKGRAVMMEWIVASCERWLLRLQ